GITAMLAADAQFQFGISLATLLSGHLYQLADAVAVERLEGIDFEDLDLLFGTWLFQAVDVFQQEFALCVVAAEAKGGLGEVVSAKAEELGLAGDLVRSQGSTWQLDHSAELVFDG